VLKLKKDDKRYTGYTENLKLRFEQRNKGLVHSAENRRTLGLIYFETSLNMGVSSKAG